MTSVQQLTLAQDRLATGATYRELAAQYGISHAYVAKILHKDEIKEVLAEGMARQVALVPLAINTLQDTASQTEDKNLRLRAAEIILKNTGLSPNQSTSITLTQILNVHAQEVPASIMRVISGIQANDTPLAIGKDEDVIDVTPE